jgi:putative polyhydroxyalkanoic acid system protein
VAEPVVITISHRLGREAAKRRLDESLGRIEQQLAPVASAIRYGWSGYRLNFSFSALRQSVSGYIEIEDELVRIVITLPLLLRMLAMSLIGRVRQEASLLLDKPGTA